MTACLGTDDLRSLSDSMCADFDLRVAGIPKELCAPFRLEAARLLHELLGIYKFAALMARNEQELDAVAEIWKEVVAGCDESALRIGRLGEQHPHCGAGDYYDEVLDLRNTCNRLMQMHK